LRRPCRRFRFGDGSAFGCQLRGGGLGLFARRPLIVRGLGFANELVSFFRRHLATPDHVLHEIARALDGKPGDARGRADHVLHGRRDFAAGLLTDELSPLSQFGDGVAHVGAAMAWCAVRRCGDRRRRFGGV
jgi:hypothetical protein